MKVSIKRPNGPPDDILNDVKTLHVLIVGRATAYPGTRPGLIVVVPKVHDIQDIQLATITVEDNDA